jgi:predicted KAP-like P-loop ATPase
MRHSDRPISTPRDDVLGRSDFALALAQSIDRLQVASDGFVIGLLGPWGAGKSSVVELTLRYLTDLEMVTANGGGDAISLDDLDHMAACFKPVEPVIDAFRSANLDPSIWERHHRDREFAQACGKPGDAASALRYWDLLQKVERSPRNIVVRFSPWLIAGRAELASALIADVARASGEKLNNDVRDAFASLLSRLAQVVPLAGAAADIATGGAFGGLISAGFDISDRLAKRLTTGPTLDQVRDHLRRTLSALKDQKLLIVIDDLDRLTPAEAVEMVSLVKGLGDLPNVVYILCFDEARLSELISNALRLNGNEYLEKIVQYPVHLPPLDPGDLSRLLDADLQQLLPGLDDSDRQRLGRAWFSVLRHYLRTPRDVRRLMNAFSVAQAGLADHTDPVDLLVLEAIRVNEPSIYHWMRQNLDQLVD